MSDDVRAAAERCAWEWGINPSLSVNRAVVNELIRDAARVGEAYLGERTPRPLDDWHEDIAPFALWWKFPVAEPPYCGSPLCTDWPGYHTHWTPIPMPFAPPPGNTGVCPHE